MQMEFEGNVPEGLVVTMLEGHRVRNFCYFIMVAQARNSCLLKERISAPLTTGIAGRRAHMTLSEEM
jgi:hypothetical protein